MTKVFCKKAKESNLKYIFQILYRVEARSDGLAVQADDS
jgi:hypothetical protein